MNTFCIRLLFTAVLLRVSVAVRVQSDQEIGPVADLVAERGESEQDVRTLADNILPAPFEASQCVQALSYTCRSVPCPKDQFGPYPCVDGVCHCRQGQCQVGNRCHASCRKTLPITDDLSGGNLCARRGLLKTESGNCACAKDACFIGGACVKSCPSEGWTGPLQCTGGVCRCRHNTCAVEGVCRPTVAALNVTISHNTRDYSSGRCKMPAPLTNSVMWDPSCTETKIQRFGCKADGKNLPCLLCGSSLLQPICPVAPETNAALNEMSVRTFKRKEQNMTAHIMPPAKPKPRVMKSITYRPLHCPLNHVYDPKLQGRVAGDTKLTPEVEAVISLRENANVTAAKNSFYHDCDSWDAAIETFWGKRGRGDLRSIWAMGANTVRVVGGNPWKKHGAFLNEAASLGLDVVAGISDFPYTSTRNCQDTDNDCFSHIMLWHKQSLQSGIMENNGSYHEALKYYVLVERPEKILGDRNPRLWTKMMLSALDGFLEAERSLNVKNPESVSITITFSDETCIACEYGQLSGIGQMWELKKAMKDPTSYGYAPKNDILGAFLTRFVYSIRSFVGAFQVPSFLEHFNRLFPRHHVFLADYHGLGNNVGGAVPQNDLSLVVSEAMKTKSRLFGVSMFEFIARTVEDGAPGDDTIARMGLFETGKEVVPIHIPDWNVTDAGGVIPKCLKWAVDPVRGEDNVAAVIQAFHLPVLGKSRQTNDRHKRPSVSDADAKDEGATSGDVASGGPHSPDFYVDDAMSFVDLTEEDGDLFETLLGAGEEGSPPGEPAKLARQEGQAYEERGYVFTANTTTADSSEEHVENMANPFSKQAEQVIKDRTIKDLPVLRRTSQMPHIPGKQHRLNRLLKDSMGSREDFNALPGSTDLDTSVPARQAKCIAFGAH